jgi:hypothetical protein
MTFQTIPDPVRSDTDTVTSGSARYTIEDRRQAIADLDACATPDLESATVLGALMAEVRANARGGAWPEQTRRVLALADVYEERQRVRLGYGTVPKRVAALAGDAA